MNLGKKASMLMSNGLHLDKCFPEKTHRGRLNVLGGWVVDPALPLMIHMDLASPCSRARTDTTGGTAATPRDVVNFHMCVGIIRRDMYIY